MRTKETGVGNCLTLGVGNYVIPPLGNYLTLQGLRLGNYVIADTCGEGHLVLSGSVCETPPATLAGLARLLASVAALTISRLSAAEQSLTSSDTASVTPVSILAHSVPVRGRVPGPVVGTSRG